LYLALVVRLGTRPGADRYLAQDTRDENRGANGTTCGGAN